ncbi:MAG: hypothetical protein JST08_17795 [Actinobacteria bacterium]|nr:hypothetical protein [Actinomycetota bacterium]
MSAANRSAGAVLVAAGDPVAAMKAMRSARRRRYVARTDVMEVLYRVYLGALAAVFVLAFLAGALHEVPADPSSVEGIRGDAPAIIGIAVAVLVLAGLRAGARGGPLAIEAAEVRYTLLAPVSRRTALRPAALAQLRTAVIFGVVFGAVVGNFVFRRFPGSALEWIGALAAFGALVPVAVLGGALVASGRRLRPPVAGAIGLALVVWSAFDLALGWSSSPATMLGDVATLPLQHGASAWLAALGAVLALALLAAGLFSLGGLGLEAAQRRAQLVAEMRFSASVQDLRTVILLRRQLASEHPRRKPWVRLPGAVTARRHPASTPHSTAAESVPPDPDRRSARLSSLQSPRPGPDDGRSGTAAVPQSPPPGPDDGRSATVTVPPPGGRPVVVHPIWRRDWQSFLRWPTVRVVRVVLIAVAAGGLAVGGFDLTPVLFALPGPLLFVAALDLIEPLAQESDHPTRRLLLPRRSSELLRSHLIAPVVAMAVVLALATIAAAGIGGDPGLALGVGAAVFLPLAVVLVCAAAVSATNDPYEFALNPQLSQAFTIAPIAVALIAGFLPLFVAWKIEGGNSARISGVLGIDFVLVVLAFVGIGGLALRFNKREREAQ